MAFMTTKEPNNIVPIRPDVKVEPNKSSDNWLSIRKHITVGKWRWDLDPGLIFTLPGVALGAVGFARHNLPLEIVGGSEFYGALFWISATRSRRRL